MTDVRAKIVAEALSWSGTPFHHEARVKGRDGGVDCAMLIAETFHAVGLVQRIEVDHYPPDWHLHRDEERYLVEVLKHADEAPDGYEPLPGDIAVWKIGRCFSHGAIVLAWPVCLHAHIHERVGFVDAEIDARFQSARGVFRPRKIFVLRALKGQA